MKARLWVNLALLVGITALVALIYFKPGIKTPPAVRTLTTLPAKDINAIKILRNHEPAVTLARDGTHWQMLTPAKVPADDYLISTVLNSIHAVVRSSFPARPSALGRFGLAPPHLRLWLNHTEFDFGGTEPLDDYRYVKSGTHVQLIRGLLYYRIDHTPLWWASKRLLPRGAHIVGLQLPNATLTLEGNAWQLAPANPAISSDAIQTLVENWDNAQAISVTAVGHGKPQGDVAIELAGEADPLRFAILRNRNFLVLARPALGLQYELERDQRDSLLELQPAKSVAKPKPGLMQSDRQPVASRPHR